VPGIVLGAEETAVMKTDQVLALTETKVTNNE
jgi:hypothetical protein